MMPVSENARAGDSQSISKAVAVLKAVADRPGCSLGEIAKQTGMPRSTVQRLVNSLNNEGLLTKNFGHQGIYLGMELARLGARVHLDARTLLRPFMEKLHEETGDNIDLTALEHGKVVVIDQIASNEQIRVISFVGKQHPIHCTANGKAHLSLLNPEDAEKLLKEGMTQLTRNTIVDSKVLMAQVAAFREIGLFIDREEFGEDACAMATTLPSIGGRQLTISIAAPRARFNRKEEHIKTALLAFRRDVQQTFGTSI
ncbi:IclR family transcriptional regulator (plasmid) [Shinella sp. H4-D48]|uniref:IclR family transcriptional regulator n=1 Tax=Shinella sp. H4-D48 TaxID=2925841 RepID=UPI001F52C6DF|nr:IclR family transcriptional regulator [Shinella sp. H4-D48]UNK39954.1 IclR family transcriptional regulator [Shinella sp. H4-D48]